MASFTEEYIGGYWWVVGGFPSVTFSASVLNSFINSPFTAVSREELVISCVLLLPRCWVRPLRQINSRPHALYATQGQT